MARVGLATWLRSGRLQRKLSLQDVAKITKIQPRILEKLESGQLDGLPADVFVKGFVRSFAKCVGLPESEAIERYGAAQSGQATAIARALVETMSPTVRLIEPHTLTSEREPSVDLAIEAAPGVVATPVVAAPVAVAAPVVAAPVENASTEDSAPIAASPVVEIAAALSASLETSASATPKKKRASRKKSTTAAPKSAGEATDAAPAIVAESVLAASTDSAAPTAPAPKAPRSRKKKTTVTPVVAAAVVEAATADAAVSSKARSSTGSATDARTSAVDAPEALSGIAMGSPSESLASLDIAAESLPETTPFIRVAATSAGELSVVDSMDLAELHEAASFAMSLTSEYEIELSIDDTDSSDGAAELQLAEGSQRISSSAIASLGSAEERSGAEGRRVDTIEFEDRTSGTWQPTMPALSSTPSAPWRRPQLPTQNAYVVPSLVIDDADPDSADREREVRASKDHSRLSFLPPILRDREDRSARQGGLTLAVIILLIAATLTLSYLMRRPSPSGDGVTLLDGQTQLYS